MHVVSLGIARARLISLPGGALRRLGGEGNLNQEVPGGETKRDKGLTVLYVEGRRRKKIQQEFLACRGSRWEKTRKGKENERELSQKKAGSRPVK